MLFELTIYQKSKNYLDFTGAKSFIREYIVAYIKEDKSEKKRKLKKA